MDTQDSVSLSAGLSKKPREASGGRGKEREINFIKMKSIKSISPPAIIIFFSCSPANLAKAQTHRGIRLRGIKLRGTLRLYSSAKTFLPTITPKDIIHITSFIS